MVLKPDYLRLRKDPHPYGDVFTCNTQWLKMNTKGGLLVSTMDSVQLRAKVNFSTTASMH